MCVVRYQSINPYNGELVKSFEEHTNPQLETAIATAVTCFNSWGKLTFCERAAVVAKTADILRGRADEFARPATLEMGKLLAESVGEVMLSADIFDYYAKHAERFLAPEHLDPNSGENVVTVKHSGTVPECAIAFEQLWLEAGAPVGAYTNLLISHDQVLKVIDDPRIRGVALTGGVAAAKGAAERAVRNIKKSMMELGGSDALIVLEDADLDKALTWALWAKMNNTGQCCIAAKRFIIVEELADQFLSKFKAAIEALIPGDPMDGRTTPAPLSTEGALVQLVKQVDGAISHGATFVLGGKRVDRPGAFMPPTIPTDFLPDNSAYREEFFGPMALFFRVKDKEAAIALASDSDYGLGDSVITQDIWRGKRVASRIETGMVFVNHPTWTAADLPFGGIKKFGYGHELSRYGIHEFVNNKLVRVAPIDAPA